MLYIGVDLGTSAVKLLLMSKDGKIQKIVSKEYPISFPNPGWSEQKPEDWWEKTVEGIKELTAECDKSQVAGISFGGQMHGLVILDSQDQVIRPAILWNDGRTGKETNYLNEVIGKEKLSEYTANIAFAGFTAPKILWVKENEPENFARISKIMLPKDYLAYKLSGVHCSDYSDASGMLLMDVKNKCWSGEMLNICGIREEQMPRLYESYETVGTLKREVAEELGLPENCKIAAGAGDNAAAAVGTGTVGDGMCNISLGTSGTIFISSKEFGVDKYNALHAFAHADGHYHLMGCMLSAASCNKWWMDEIIGTADYAGEQGKIGNLGENHVYFLPYLMGERSPHNNPDARGTFIGLTMDSTREDMTQAVLEGVAFAIRDSFEVAKSLGIKIERTKICGGGAKSPLWKKMIANILNIKVDVIASEEGPAMGGAMLAAVANGEYASVEEAAEAIVKVVDTVEPEPALAVKYDERYKKFAKIYPAVKNLFSEIL
ncbi:xylulokinase [Lactonifactor longoviformis]|uniref:xylulokinase n=1 Tax=Lactonifactor TaxID=420345 RepID=UPI0012B13E09|nr:MULTISPECIES: xylulokinase [Lactonifactor]MCQ4671701.1 xylulokinase [Lactonifactor longoviformis]MSA04098.1 xylulokinase [Lactonifactor sp. BIOML-A5]MSA09930.1 xylulokinase [Lactonifactor sp. BIOML-A4]MSA15199.1 xylulokinase [Lactonifactor sp. BIOML-A3]MSA19639.1 xylulokinase [Lactonifactor sp. BIOML-A2]